MPWIVTRQPPQHGRCHFRVSQTHHVQHIGPTGPERGVPASVCIPQTQPAHHQRHACDVPSVCGDCGVQELFETPLDAVIVADRELESCTRVQHPQDVVGTRGCAKQEEQLCALQI